MYSKTVFIIIEKFNIYLSLPQLGYYLQIVTKKCTLCDTKYIVNWVLLDNCLPEIKNSSTKNKLKHDIN